MCPAGQVELPSAPLSLSVHAEQLGQQALDARGHLRRSVPGRERVSDPKPHFFWFVDRA